MASEPTKKIILRGITGAPGITEGKVKKIANPFQAANISQGEIAVAEYTSPVLAISLRQAKAIVCEKGTATSHAAVVSREWGIPCLVSVKDALKVLNDNDWVVVDADEGVIYRN